MCWESSLGESSEFMKKLAFVFFFPAILILSAGSLPAQEKDKWENYFGAGVRAMQQGDLPKAELLFKASRLKAELEGEAGHPRAPDMLMDSLNALSVVLRERGKSAEAETVLRDQVQLFSDSGAADQNPQRSSTLHNLGLVLFDQNKFDEARVVLEQAVALRRKYDPLPHRNLAISLLSLGGAYFHQDKVPAAEAAVVDAGAILSKISATDRTPADTAAVMRSEHNLALIYVHQKKYELAEQSYKAAILTMETLYGPSSAGLTLYLNNYAKLLRALKRDAEAKAVETRAEKISNNRNN